jgi:chromosome segregation ATPase
MNDESVPKTRESARAGAVIKPWLSAGLVIALAGNVLFSAVLIVKLSGFEEIKKQADEIATEAAQKRAELSSLQTDVDSLNKQKEALAPTVADWEERLKEKAAAEAVLATLEGKQKQAELDIAQDSKRLEEIKGNVLDSERQKTDLDAAVERIRSELASLTMTNIDIKAELSLAADAERRLSEATNGLADATARRVQLDADVTAAQARFGQLQKDSDDLRQTGEKANAQAATLRQQIQSLKDQLTAFNQQAVELTNRLVLARSQTAEWETNRDTSQQAGIKAAQDLAVAQKLLAETQASQDQLAREQAKLVAQIDASKKDLAQSRNDAAAAEAHFESVKADSQKAEADVSAARTLAQEFSAKQGELTREVSRLEAIIEGLKKQKEALEKEVGGLEGQKPAQPSK